MPRCTQWVGCFGALLALGAALGAPHRAYALETIPSFDARIGVNADATISVEEQIVYDFGEAQRHGIFRTIPVSYQAGGTTYTADVSQVVVVGTSGTPIPFVESHGNGALTLKVGDAHTLVSGKQTYTISYVVHGPFLYWDDHDEFYWNVTGSWPNAITRASVHVDLPPGSTVLDASCYQGAQGSSHTCSASEESASSTGYRASAQSLAVGEGFTVALTFPKGTIAEPMRRGKGGMPRFLLFWPLFLPVCVAGAMVYLWYTRGRDPRGRGTIVTEFAPPEGITPAMAGVLYNERLEDRELSAEIVRLAVEGFVKLHRIEDTVLFLFRTTDYLIERMEHGEPTDPLSLRLLERLFQPAYVGSVVVEGKEVAGALLSRMRHAFARDRSLLEDTIYDEVVLEGLFPTRPDRVRTWYAVAGGCGAGLGILLASWSGATSAVLALSSALSGMIVAIGGLAMPVRTALGVRTLEQLEGFKRYLTVAEKDRIAFHNAPERTPALFDRFLPYAIALGVEQAWAAQFADVYQAEPAWYAGGHLHTFAAGALVSDLSSFTRDFSAAAAPQHSGVSGGGSVGGGFGGGGGGSW